MKKIIFLSILLCHLGISQTNKITVNKMNASKNSENASEDFLVKADMYRNYIAMIATDLAAGSGTMIGIYPNVILARVNETGDHYITVEIDLASLRNQRKHSRCFHQRAPEKYKVITSKISPQDKYK